MTWPKSPADFANEEISLPAGECLSFTIPKWDFCKRLG
ncbi:Uncharacterized protein pbN1_16510 [Aromatoleum bremense]|nr:Uncharacterized protein pbN1_16510 [Aromatoleum bremense]